MTPKPRPGRNERLARQAAQLPTAELSEVQYQAWIVQQATALGWGHQFHVRRAQVKGVWLTNTSSPGVPDLWLLRPPHLVVLEVKKVGGKPSADQLAWIAGLQQVPGVAAYVVDPTDAADVLDLLTQPR